MTNLGPKSAKMSVNPAYKSGVYLVMVLMSILLSDTDGETLVVYPKHPQVKKIDTGAMFTCTIEDYIHHGTEPDIFWRASHGEIVTDTKGRVHVERVSSDSLTLYISSVKTEDAGLYSCESIIGGALFNVDTKLEIFEDIEFREGPDKLVYKTGDNPFLECSATGHPQPIISWRFNRKYVIPDDKKYKYEDNRGLRIYNLNREDAGFYECRAEVTSQGNLKVKVITVDVKYKPFMSYQPAEITEVIMGEPAELKCQGLGNPEVRYQWFKEQEAGAHAKVKVMLRENTDTYVMEDVAMADGGRYFCKVSNEMGSEEVYTDVVVFEKPDIEELPTEKALELNVLFLNCRFKGYPEPVVTWQRIGTDHPYVVGVQPDDARIKVDNSRPGISQLVIHEIQRSYTGQYKCTAVNIAGNDSSIANITVEYVPTVRTTTPEKYGWPGQVREFICIGNGLPLPTINWLREGQYISNSTTYQVYTQVKDQVTSTLQINIQPNQPWVFGSYSCIAKNRYNYVRTSVHLREATTPDMPRNMTIEEEKPTVIRLKASLPIHRGGLPITSWRIQYQPIKSDNMLGEDFENVAEYDEGEKELIFQTDDKLEVTDLTPDMEYTFYLSIGNEVGYSDPIKFKARTPKQHKEQADLPGNPDDPDAGILRTGGEGKEALNYNNKFKEVKSDSPSLMSIAIAVGATVVGVVVVVIVGLAICLRKRSRAKEDDYTATWKSMFGSGKKVPMGEDGAVVKVSESKDIDQMQLEIRRIDGSQPDLLAQASPKPTHLDKCRSPLEVRKQNGYTGSPKKCPVELTAGTPNSIQQRAWEHMLIAKDMEPEEPIEVPGLEKQDELTPMMDLPPPPPFLLDNNEIMAPHSDNVSYHDILDGYHSEDNNIDDGDEFEIRAPHLLQNNHQNQHHPAT